MSENQTKTSWEDRLWFIIASAVLAAILVSHFFVGPTRGVARGGHHLMKVVHSPEAKRESRNYGKVVFVTGMADDWITAGNLYMCKVPDQAYEWAESMDTIQLRLSECWQIAP